MKKGPTFDHILRTPNLNIPKEVHYMPKTTINFNKGKKKHTKEEMQKVFMRNDSDESFEIEDM